jgi:predicted ATPase
VGRLSDGETLIDQRIETTDSRGDLYYLPELLRIRARLLLASGEPDLAATEAFLKRSLELSRRHGALGWELRAAIDLSELWSRDGRAGRACELLEQVIGSIMEGHATADLITATRVLRECRRKCV